MKTRLEIAEEILGHALDAEGYAPCPGEDLHSNKTGRRDFRVKLDGAPTGYCFHGSCANVVQEFNLKLRRAVWAEEQGSSGKKMPATDKAWERVAPPPKAQPPARPDLDDYAIWEAVRGVPAVDEPWLARRSPVAVETTSAGAFLDRLFRPEERVLVFTSQMSQGDFLWRAGEPGRGYRLAAERGVKAKPSALPPGGGEGVWFLVQPVTGVWEISAQSTWGHGGKEVHGKWTRRSQVNVTAWRHFVLESDVIEAERWLKVLVSLRFPIAAIYTSGGRSVHALVRHEVSSKAEWDAAKNLLKQIVCPLGADPGALTAVRLSRLPGCRRGNNLQRLLYLNPSPEPKAIQLMPEVRG